MKRIGETFSALALTVAVAGCSSNINHEAKPAVTQQATPLATQESPEPTLVATQEATPSPTQEAQLDASMSICTLIDPADADFLQPPYYPVELSATCFPEITPADFDQHSFISAVIKAGNVTKTCVAVDSGYNGINPDQLVVDFDCMPTAEQLAAS